jgi:hypothetical protein
MRDKRGGGGGTLFEGRKGTSSQGVLLEDLVFPVQLTMRRGAIPGVSSASRPFVVKAGGSDASQFTREVKS